MINSQETQRHCRGKQDNETVYYVELEGKKTERAYLKFTKRPGGEKQCVNHLTKQRGCSN